MAGVVPNCQAILGRPIRALTTSIIGRDGLDSDGLFRHGILGHGLCNCRLYSYDIYSGSPYNDGLYTYGVHSHGLYSHGRCGYRLCSHASGVGQMCADKCTDMWRLRHAGEHWRLTWGRETSAAEGCECVSACFVFQRVSKIVPARTPMHACTACWRDAHEFSGTSV